MAPSIISFSHYEWQHWITLSVFLAAAGFAVYSTLCFLKLGLPESWGDAALRHWKLIILFWTLAPPAWFFIEHYVLWGGNPDSDCLKRIEMGRELAQPFWAAVLATLLFLIPNDRP
jgi:hypothetical protein